MKKMLSLMVVAALAASPCLAQTQSKTGKKPKKQLTEEERRVREKAPEGATAYCGDRSYSFSQSKKPCEGHEGLVYWLTD